ncbi:MAG: hypothetical protein ACXWNU_08960, partial [Candidatus Binataceae bacterium]
IAAEVTDEGPLMSRTESALQITIQLPCHNGVTIVVQLTRLRLFSRRSAEAARTRGFGRNH